MISKEDVLEAIRDPMKKYYAEMTSVLGNWLPLERAAEKLLQGKEASDDEVPNAYLPLLKMMRLIAKVTKESEWDWSNPDIQSIFKDKADSHLYKVFTNAIVGTVSSIFNKVKVGTLVEVGTGPGQVTKNLCEEMVKNNIAIPIVISDMAPAIKQTRETLIKAFPSLNINAFNWNIKEKPPKELVDSLAKPVLVFERFCLPYAGHDAIDMISPIADILIIQDDLSLTGKKMTFDILYGKIGTQFLTFREAKNRLEKHFSFIHICDRDVTQAINSNVATFTLAIK